MCRNKEKGFTNFQAPLYNDSLFWWHTIIGCFDPNIWVLLRYLDVFKTPSGMNNQEVVAILYANQSISVTFPWAIIVKLPSTVWVSSYWDINFLCIPSIAFSFSWLDFPRKPLWIQAAYSEETLSYHGLISVASGLCVGWHRYICGFSDHPPHQISEFNFSWIWCHFLLWLVALN